MVEDAEKNIKEGDGKYYEMLPTGNNRPERKICEFPNCCRVFSNSFSLKRHMRLHEGEKKFKCSQCDKMFMWEHSVQRHENTHLQVLNWHCQYPNCLKKFKLKEYLDIHMKTHPTDKLLLSLTNPNIEMSKTPSNAYVSSSSVKTPIPPVVVGSTPPITQIILENDKKRNFDVMSSNVEQAQSVNSSFVSQETPSSSAQKSTSISPRLTEAGFISGFAKYSGLSLSTPSSTSPHQEQKNVVVISATQQSLAATKAPIIGNGGGGLKQLELDHKQLKDREKLDILKANKHLINSYSSETTDISGVAIEKLESLAELDLLATVSQTLCSLSSMQTAHGDSSTSNNSA